MPALQAGAMDDDSTESHPQRQRQRQQRDDAAAASEEERLTSAQGPSTSSPSPSSPSASEGARALLACSVSAWPLPLRRLSFATEFLQLPDDVATWMRSGGRVWLPEGSLAMPVRAEMDEFDIAEERERFGDGGDGREGGQGAGESDSDSDSAAEKPPPGLADFSVAVDRAIARLGGRAFPKLDWSAPMDASWLRPGGSLECTCADEVMLLLKSSDRISHDLEELSRISEAIESDGSRSSLELKNLTPTLALRKWHSLRPGAEFRVFMEEKCELVALCQRDITQHFEGLARDRPKILKDVARFVRRELAPALSQVARPASPTRGQRQQPSPSSPLPSLPRLSALASSRLVADVYIHASGKVRLVDLALPGGTTSPLMFSSWEEVFPPARSTSDGADVASGSGNDDEGREDASDAELSLDSCSSNEGEESDDEEEAESGGGGRERQRVGSAAAAVDTATNSKKRVRFRVVSAAGGIALGRTLYGAPHDFLDGECVEALVERLRTSEG